MASGFGYSGGRSRCFPFWQDFQKCYAGADLPNECTLQKEDYLECLHHTKEVSRAMTIKSQYLSKTAHELAARKAETDAKVETGILGLGLLSHGTGQLEEGAGGHGGKESKAAPPPPTPKKEEKKDGESS